MKNIKKILLGYLFAALFVLGAATLGANLVGCGSDCPGKAPTGDCSGCANTDSDTSTCDPT